MAKSWIKFSGKLSKSYSIPVYAEQPDRTDMVASFKQGDQNSVRWAIALVNRVTKEPITNWTVLERTTGTVNEWVLMCPTFVGMEGLNGAYKAGIIKAEIRRRKSPRARRAKLI